MTNSSVIPAQDTSWPFLLLLLYHYYLHSGTHYFLYRLFFCFYSHPSPVIHQNTTVCHQFDHVRILRGPSLLTAERTTVHEPNLAHCPVLLKKLYWNTTTFIHLCVFMATLMQWLTWVVMKEIIGPVKPKIFTTWPFTEKVCWPLAWSINQISVVWHKRPISTSAVPACPDSCSLVSSLIESNTGFFFFFGTWSCVTWWLK